MITIITATLNEQLHLPELINSLEQQTSKNFIWIVADGGSSDGTIELIQQFSLKNDKVLLTSQKDFGIYDAINRAVERVETEFYLVVGADDTLFPDAVHTFEEEIKIGTADLISAVVLKDGKPSKVRKPRWEALFSQFAYVHGHAVSLAIRRSLHDRAGFYSSRFPIAADQYFILNAIHLGARVRCVEKVVGSFGSHGVSNSDALGVLSEIMRVNVALGHSLMFQIILLLLRLMKSSLLKTINIWKKLSRSKLSSYNNSKISN
jgi:glycosyltransferase involved in cell wall biosynthesis